MALGHQLPGTCGFFSKISALPFRTGERAILRLFSGHKLPLPHPTPTPELGKIASNWPPSRLGLLPFWKFEVWAKFGVWALEFIFIFIFEEAIQLLIEFAFHYQFCLKAKVFIY